MTLRGADLRFVLGHEVGTAVVLADPGRPELARIGEGFRASGVDVGSGPPASASQRPVDLVVGSTDRAEEALEVPARAHLLAGRMPPRRLRGRGAQVDELLVLGPLDRPFAVVPLASRAALVHYLTAVAAPSSRAGTTRNRLVAALTRSGALPTRAVPSGRVLTLVEPYGEKPVPRLLQVAAAAADRPSSPDWVLVLGHGDDLQRAVLHVLPAGQPPWVAKFRRVRGADDAFDREEAAARLVAASPVVAAHAPALLARAEVDGLPLAVETLATGRPFVEVVGRSPQRARELVDEVAGWLVDVAVGTATGPADLGPERRRLQQEVLARWPGVADLVAGLPDLPGVLQHNDLGTWNLLVDAGGFTAVDWESARGVGLPLWDLLYFLGDALARLDGPATPEVLLDRCVAVHAGRSPHSAVLQRWVGEAVRRLDLPREAVGPVATLCWLHHGLSAQGRADALGDATPAPLGHLARMAGPWLEHPDLGITWSAWEGR